MRTGLRPQKILVASGARVAPGGESGWFQWLVPALVVIVVLFAALTVRSEADRSSRAATSATRAQAFAAAARESSALREAVRASHGHNASIKAQAGASLARVKEALVPLQRSTPGDAEVDAISKLVAAAPKAPSLTPLTTAADGLTHRLDDQADSAATRAHQRLTLTLVGSALLAALMLWSFFSKRARVSLERSERRFRSLVEHSTELLVVVDEKQRMRFLTPAFQRRLGYEVDELLGECLLDHVHRDDREQEAGDEPLRWRVR